MPNSAPLRSMISDEIAIEVVRLGMVREWSTASALRRLTDLAARAVPGCAGATCSRWHPDEPDAPVLRAASHPELAELVDLQLAQDDGPELEAKRAKDTIRSDDTLTETRWPHIIPAMLRRGIRSFHTTLYESDQTLVTLTLYGVLPGVLDVRSSALVSLLAAQGGAAVSNTQQYDEAQRTVVQLQEAVEARAIVDQAKGILMNRFGYDADRAFAELRRISQTRHVKLTVLARRIVSSQGLKP